jgi:hypothetical protein
VLETGASSTWFPLRIGLVFERYTAFKSRLKALFGPNKPIYTADMISIQLQRKASMLEAAASSTLFPCEN